MDSSTFEIDEMTSGVYTAKLRDEAGLVVPGSILSTLKLTLWDDRSGSIINTRSNQNVLNTNGVTVDETGLLTWTITQADTPIVNASTPGRSVTNGKGKAVEVHYAFFRATWGVSAAKAVNHLVQLNVINFDKLP